MNTLFAKSKENGGVTLAEHTEHVIKAIEIISGYYEIDRDSAFFGALLHDLGKGHPLFQKRLAGEAEDQLQRLVSIPYRHEIASLFFLPLLEKKFWTDVTEMVLGHHKSIKDKNISKGKGLLDLLEYYEEDEIFETYSKDWELWHKKVLATISPFISVPNEIPLSSAKEAFLYTVEYAEGLEKNWSRLRGLLNSADFLASALTYRTEDYLGKMFEKPDIDFFLNPKRVSEFYPLSFKKYISENKHTLVTAPTGAGKTDYLLKRCSGRIFYTLPFQASINAMYERLKEVIPNDVRLLHASSRLKIQGDKVEEEKALQTLPGASVKILTPYQLAALVFGTRGFESIAMDIDGCDVILDEVHVYTGVSRALIIEIVRTLLKLDCRIHIGTATLPSVLRNEIINLLGENNILFTELNKNELTLYNRHTIHKHNYFEETMPILDNALANKEKVLVVCNRVAEAQKKFEIISDRYPKIEKMLIHSRFKRVDRTKKEDELTNYFNKLDEACVVVSTQVVEVSLDISFDRMITDCAPIDGLIQRFGRINRKRNAETKGIIRPIHIIAPPDNKRDALPYDREILQRSFDVLENNTPLIENTLQEKIDLVYPEIEKMSLESFAVFGDNEFKLMKLQHNNKSAILDCLEIESACCLIENDVEKYKSGNFEERVPLEIPISPFSLKGSFPSLYQLERGNNPWVISNELYSIEKGLEIKKIDNFL